MPNAGRGPGKLVGKGSGAGAGAGAGSSVAGASASAAAVFGNSEEASATFCCVSAAGCCDENPGIWPSKPDKSLSAAAITVGTPSALPRKNCTGTVIGKATTWNTAKANCAK